MDVRAFFTYSLRMKSARARYAGTTDSEIARRPAASSRVRSAAGTPTGNERNGA